MGNCFLKLEREREMRASNRLLLLIKWIHDEAILTHWQFCSALLTAERMWISKMLVSYFFPKSSKTKKKSCLHFTNVRESLSPSLDSRILPVSHLVSVTVNQPLAAHTRSLFPEHRLPTPASACYTPFIPVLLALAGCLVYSLHRKTNIVCVTYLRLTCVYLPASCPDDLLLVLHNSSAPLFLGIPWIRKRTITLR